MPPPGFKAGALPPRIQAMIDAQRVAQIAKLDGVTLDVAAAGPGQALFTARFPTDAVKEPEQIKALIELLQARLIQIGDAK